MYYNGNIFGSTTARYHRKTLRTITAGRIRIQVKKTQNQTILGFCANLMFMAVHIYICMIVYGNSLLFSNSTFGIELQTREQK